jgi:hypothetical protein
MRAARGGLARPTFAALAAPNRAGSLLPAAALAGNR